MESEEPRAVVPPPRSVAARELPLINRSKEMQLLRTTADRAIHGEGSVVFLRGEAGIGKTRLARELGAYARSQGMQVLSGRCPALFQMDGLPPYVLWEEVIRNYLDICTPEQLFRVIGAYPIEVSKLVPELKQKLRTLPQSFPLSPERSRDRLFEAVSQLITNISREAPLLVILDDLQWTDQSSLLLLHYLARGIRKESLLLLGAYRGAHVDKQHPLSPVLTELNRERLLHSLLLKRLSIDDVSEMIARILGQDDLPASFCELVYTKTRGNPFFVEEVIKSLKEEAVIHRVDNKWTVEAVERIAFPETVKDVIKTRISRLDADAQQLLTMGSFVGKDFTFKAIRGATRMEEDKLLLIVERLLETGLLEEKVIIGEDGFSFADAIVRDVIYEEVSQVRRKKLHHVIGAALEEVYSEKIEPHFGELAHHFLEAGDKKKALEYFLQAGKNAYAVYAYDEAASDLQHALTLTPETENARETRADVVERLGDLQFWSGHMDVGLDFWNQALTLYTQLRLHKKIANLHIKMARVHWSVGANKAKASQHHQMALQILEDVPESHELAELYEDIAHMLWRTGEAADASEWALKAHKLAERLDDSEVLAAVYNDLGVFSMKSGDRAKALKYQEKGLTIALENNHIGTALLHYNNLSENHWVQGAFQTGFEAAKKGRDLAKKVGALGHLSWISSVLAGYHIYMGKMQKALSMFEASLILDKRIKFNAHIPYGLWGLGECYLWRGEWEKSLHYLLEANAEAKHTSEYQAEAMSAYSLGKLFMAMGDYAEAEKHLTEGIILCDKTQEVHNKLAWVFPTLAKLYLKQGKLDQAQNLIKAMADYVAKSGNRWDSARVQMLWGMLFRVQGSLDKALQHFKTSFEKQKPLQMEKWDIRGFTELLFEYGSALLDRDTDDDRNIAYSLLKQALAIYQRTGAKKKIEALRVMMTSRNIQHEMIFARTPTVSKTPVVVLPEFVSTGHPKLDEMLFGGIKQTQAVILTSPSCDEKDRLIKQFLATGIRNGEVTFHITIYPGKVKALIEKFPLTLYLFICNPQADKIIENKPAIYKMRGVENLNEINIALTTAFRKLSKKPRKTRRICIEIISDVLLQHQALHTRRWLTGLLPELKSRGFTTLAVMDPGMHSVQETRAVIDLFDGEINIHENETTQDAKKLLKIKKMYNQDYSKEELELKD